MARKKSTGTAIRDRVAHRVRQARLSKGWSREQLAEALGVSVETVSRYEGGKLALSVEMLDKAAGVRRNGWGAGIGRSSWTRSR